MTKILPLPAPSGLPTLATIRRNATKYGLAGKLEEELHGEDNVVQIPPDFVGPLRCDRDNHPGCRIIKLKNFLLLRAKLAGKAGERSAKRLVAINELRLKPNSPAWVTHFKNQ